MRTNLITERPKAHLIPDRAYFPSCYIIDDRHRGLLALTAAERVFCRCHVSTSRRIFPQRDTELAASISNHLTLPPDLPYG
jgi:hypothetical protein